MFNYGLSSRCRPGWRMRLEPFRRRWTVAKTKVIKFSGLTGEPLSRGFNPVRAIGIQFMINSLPPDSCNHTIASQHSMPEIPSSLLRHDFLKQCIGWIQQCIVECWRLLFRQAYPRAKRQSLTYLQYGCNQPNVVQEVLDIANQSEGPRTRDSHTRQ